MLAAVCDGELDDDRITPPSRPGAAAAAAAGTFSLVVWDWAKDKIVAQTHLPQASRIEKDVDVRPHAKHAAHAAHPPQPSRARRG
jgi:hypothetical protein